MAISLNANNVKVTGITGSVPVCTKIRIQSAYSNALDGTPDDDITQAVQNNDPNITYSGTVLYNDNKMWRVILYNKNDKVIAQSEWKYMSLR